MKQDFSKSPAIEQVAIERLEQIEKHGWTQEIDLNYEKKELRDAALYAMTLDPRWWPIGWSEHFRQKIYAKTRKQRMVVAAALLCAEIDRLDNGGIDQDLQTPNK